MADKAPSPRADYRVEVTLLGVHPRVARTIQLPADTSLARLHRVLQVAMGWSDSHLHQFEIDGVVYTEIDEDTDEEALDEQATSLADVAEPGSRFWYVYDLGDEWRHEIVVREAAPAGSAPRCLAGTGAAPRENSGGPSALRSVGGPFSPESVNRALARLEQG